VIADVYTVMWKEWKELLLQRGSLRAGLFRVVLVAGAFGILLPAQMGQSWIDSPLQLLNWAWVPIFLVTSLVADAFAGERERHTLETLLASRLSDRSILFGKAAAAVAYAWALTLLTLLAGVVTVNLVAGSGGLLLIPAPMLVGGVILSLLTAGLAAGIGILVSLRASTVRQAQQTLSIATMVLLFVPLFALPALPPEWRDSLVSGLSGSGIVGILLGGGAILVILDALFLGAALARFQRAKLILD
jgi:ABC-2 type transport system permease protein